MADESVSVPAAAIQAKSDAGVGAAGGTFGRVQTNILDPAEIYAKANAGVGAAGGTFGRVQTGILDPAEGTSAAPTPATELSTATPPAGSGGNATTPHRF
jgi:hypothetical protein